MAVVRDMAGANDGCRIGSDRDSNILISSLALEGDDWFLAGGGGALAPLTGLGGRGKRRAIEVAERVVTSDLAASRGDETRLPVADTGSVRSDTASSGVNARPGEDASDRDTGGIVERKGRDGFDEVDGGVGYENDKLGLGFASASSWLNTPSYAASMVLLDWVDGWRCRGDVSGPDKSPPSARGCSLSLIRLGGVIRACVAAVVCPNS